MFAGTVFFCVQASAYARRWSWQLSQAHGVMACSIASAAIQFAKPGPLICHTVRTRPACRDVGQGGARPTGPISGLLPVTDGRLTPSSNRRLMVWQSSACSEGDEMARRPTAARNDDSFLAASTQSPGSVGRHLFAEAWQQRQQGFEVAFHLAHQIARGRRGLIGVGIVGQAVLAELHR